tara:strand:+ start:18 stop:320 length:303 start_codon:yes stop_codon:yes gene_type:complete
MKKLWKYIAGFFTIVIGGLLAFLSGKGAGRKDEKFKGLKGESKKVSKRIKDREKETTNVKQSLKNKKKALDEIKKKQYKNKKVSHKEAADFLKKYAKKKK